MHYSGAYLLYSSYFTLCIPIRSRQTGPPTPRQSSPQTRLASSTFRLFPLFLSAFERLRLEGPCRGCARWEEMREPSDQHLPTKPHRHSHTHTQIFRKPVSSTSDTGPVRLEHRQGWCFLSKVIQLHQSDKKCSLFACLITIMLHYI